LAPGTEIAIPGGALADPAGNAGVTFLPGAAVSGCALIGLGWLRRRTAVPVVARG